MDPAGVKLAKRLVHVALDRYYTVSVQSGPDWTIERSRSARDIFKAMFLEEPERLRFRTMLGKFVGDVMIVYSFGEDAFVDWSNKQDIKMLIEEAKK